MSAGSRCWDACWEAANQLFCVPSCSTERFWCRVAQVSLWPTLTLSQCSAGPFRIDFALKRKETMMQETLPSLLQDRQTKRNAVERKRPIPTWFLSHWTISANTSNGTFNSQSLAAPQSLSVESRAPSLSSRSEMQTEVWFPATTEKTFKLDKSWYYSSTLRAIFCQRHLNVPSTLNCCSWHQGPFRARGSSKHD